ncbi:MAG TPA: hypothetical protein VF808_13155 [Ktedonobacterales bacterium]
MTTTIFKILLTPALIWAVSLAGRRWGAAVSGLLIGLPLTSGPVALFIALESGRAFARQTASGILLGSISVALFCLVYAWLAARRWPWPAAMAGGWLATMLSTLALDRVRASGLVALAIAAVVILTLNWLMPHAGEGAESGAAPWWDIPARMVVATSFVVALTTVAPALGAHLSGLLATLPIYASILVCFNHALFGSPQAIRFARGLALGLFGFIAFFAALEALLAVAPLWLSFGAASLAALATQAALGWFTHARAARLPTPDASRFVSLG